MEWAALRRTGQAGRQTNYHYPSLLSAKRPAPMKTQDAPTATELTERLNRLNRRLTDRNTGGGRRTHGRDLTCSPRPHLQYLAMEQAEPGLIGRIGTGYESLTLARSLALSPPKYEKSARV